MNKDQLGGKLDEFNARVKRKWGELSDNEITDAEGNVELLAAKVRQKYGDSEEVVRKQLDELHRDV